MKKYLLILLVVLIACKKDNRVDDYNSNVEINYLNETIQYKSIEGIENNLLSLDIYYGDNINSLKPIIFYVHGGAWCIGDKSQQIENKVSLFNSLGYVFVSINYRLSPFPYEIFNTERVKYPIHNIDIADALKWVRDNIEDYGGNKDEIALIGHSAGAQLVALTSTNTTFIEEVNIPPSSIKGVAVIDTKGYNIHSNIESGSTQSMYINAFGTNETENIEASAILNLSNTAYYPKYFIAKRGSEERINAANDFIDSLQNVGVEVSEVDGSIYSHAEINAAIGESNETLITEALTQFFSECFE